MPKVEVPRLELGGRSSVPQVRPPVSVNAAERASAALDAAQAAATVEDQEVRHRAAEPQPPREYNGLSGIPAEFDDIAARLNGQETAAR